MRRAIHFYSCALLTLCCAALLSACSDSGGGSCSSSADCNGLVCLDGVCQRGPVDMPDAGSCMPGCQDRLTVRDCDASGRPQLLTCGGEEVCVTTCPLGEGCRARCQIPGVDPNADGGMGDGGPPVGCADGLRVCLDQNTAGVCRDDASGYDPEACAATERCSGAGVCGPPPCQAGQRACAPGSLTQYLVCNEAGTGFETGGDCAEISPGHFCQQGTCFSRCEAAAAARSYIGCEYWPTVLDNLNQGEFPPTEAPYAVAVANPDDTVTATVMVERKVGGVIQQVGESRQVGPGQLVNFELPRMNIDDTVRGELAYRLTSDSPVTVYQFNPQDNVNPSFSNDASLLLPTSALDTEYLVMSRGQLVPETGAGDKGRGFLTVVATADGTEVSVLLSGNTVAGGGIPQHGAGETVTQSLSAFEVLQLASRGQNSDLTGSVVTSNKPVAVYGGTEASFVSEAAAPGRCCADHLEQQMFPTSTWGRTFIAARSQPRGVEQDRWRVLALQDGTEVSTDPPQPGTPFTLNAREHREFGSNVDFVIRADKPVSVGQFLAAEFDAGGDCTFSFECRERRSGSRCATATSGTPGRYCTSIGDPAFILLPPSEQFRSDYIFLTPNSYAEDYLIVVGPVGVQVTVDGTQISGWTMIGGNIQKAIVSGLTDQAHRVTSSQPVGVVVHGYDSFVSYGYAGGLDLTKFSR